MTVDELNTKIDAWNADLKALEDSLGQLEAGAAYKTAKGIDTLTAAAKDKLDDAVRTVSKLWKFRQQLATLIKDCETKRDKLPYIGRTAALAEIEALLNDATIEIPAPASIAKVNDPFADDNTNTQKVTPEGLKGMIRAKYAGAKKVLDEFAERWMALETTYSTFAHQVEALAKTISEAGRTVPSELSDMQSRLASINKKRVSDPFNLKPADIESQLQGYLTKAQVKVQEVAYEISALTADVAKAGEKLDALKLTRGRILDASNRAGDKIANVELIKVPAKTQDLTDKLEALNKLVAEHRYSDADSALLIWHRDASHLEAQWKQDEQANADLLVKSQQLSARWEAAKKKAAANVDKDLDDDKALVAYAAKAAALFAAAKLDIVEADTIISSYETKLDQVIAAFAHRPPLTRKQTLEKRLARAKATAQGHGLDSNKVLVAYEGKAGEALQKSDLDTADTMIYSYETKLGELSVAGDNGAQAPASTPAATQTASTKPAGTTSAAPSGSTSQTAAPAPGKSTKESLTARLQHASEQAQKAGKAADKPLVAYAKKAQEYLGSNDLEAAENMIYSFETRLGELAAH